MSHRALQEAGLGLDVTGNSVVITGGATGIGYALAEQFLRAGNRVIICGRRKSKLQAAKLELPDLQVRQCDVSIESQRKDLLAWTVKQFPSLNLLVNNAGIQRQLEFKSPGISKLPNRIDDEVAINLTSTIRLCALFTPRLLKAEKAALVNVSSGLAFVPIAMMPVYCATKAAIHSFTVSLRHQLRDSTVKVFEAVPPTTDTELDASFAGKEEQAERGITPQEVAAAIIEGLKADRDEILIGEAEGLYEAALKDPKSIFLRLNEW